MTGYGVFFSNSVLFAPTNPHTFLANSITAHCNPRQRPRNGTLFSLAYLHDKISAEVVLQMPLCMIDDGDKHILETDWQHGATWEFPFKRYQLAGFNKTIKSVRGDMINFETYTLEDHFKMIGYDA